MTTATKEAVLEIAGLSFGNVNVGDETARIGVKVRREGGALTISKADRVLCGKRLDVQINTAHDDDSGPVIPGTEPAPIEATVDVKTINFNRKTIGFGLTFNVEDTSVSELAKFAKRNGSLVVLGAQEIPAGSKAPGLFGSDDAEEDDGEGDEEA